ncbi:MAG: ATP-binding protein [Bacteroidales bacterium]|nr:ATP-binding protein [Bacteroidales bacterium]
MCTFALYKPSFIKISINIIKFYDRVNELKILHNNEKQSHESAVFMVLTGRRRVGKTALVTKALEGKEYAYLFVSKVSETVLCQNFQRELEQQIGINVYGNVTRFKDLFEIIMKEAQNRHLNIVIDEFQSLYKINPSVFSDIQDVWDRYKDNAKINFIATGSIQTLMKRIFEDKAEPLYGRPTSKLTLRPFKTSTIKEILQEANHKYTAEDLLCLYMITGGVPKYIELFIDAKCVTKEKMLKYVCNPDSYFLSEGKDLLNQEFSIEANTYFSILQVIASGKTKRSEIDSTLQKDTGTFLQNLDCKYELIQRNTPLLAKHNSKVSAYEIRDNFLKFWFRFICPYQSLIERQLFNLLYSGIMKNYEEFSGRTLERYFQDMIMETEQFTQVGNWWDRKGQNEIDLIAINEFDKTGIVAEVKRNPKKINLQKLEEKIKPLSQKGFKEYKLAIKTFSMDDM